MIAGAFVAWLPFDVTLLSPRCRPPSDAEAHPIAGNRWYQGSTPRSLTPPADGNRLLRLLVTKCERHQIFQWYEEAMGSERATIMMNLVPPVGWGEVATRSDLAALANGMRGEMSVLRSELRGDMAELRGEMHREIAKLRGDLFFAMVASNATLVGLVFAAVKLA